MFIKRNYTPEIMDDFSIKDERIERALNELKIINKYLGGISTTKYGLKKVFRKNSYKSKINILDAASGASDVLHSLKNNFLLEGCFVDINFHICKYIKKGNAGSKVVCCNAFFLPFKIKFDIIHTSLFLHHLNEKQIKKLLIFFLKSCRGAVIINDLRRNIFALTGIKILTSIFSKSKMIKNDAPLSVKRSFTKKDLENIFYDLGIKNFELKRKWAFRWLVIIYV